MTTEQQSGARQGKFFRRLRAFLERRRDSHEAVRSEVARAYLRGRGLEIGALHKPLRVPRGVRGPTWTVRRVSN